MQYARNFVLSAIAPDTIVAAVAQNTRLNTNDGALPSLRNDPKSVRISRFGTPNIPST